MVFAVETYCPATDGVSAARIEEEVILTPTRRRRSSRCSRPKSCRSPTGTESPRRPRTGSDQEAALANRRCTAAGYQRVNQTAPRKAAIDATMSSQSGIAGTYSAAASAATCTAKATAQTPGDEAIGREEDGQGPDRLGHALARVLQRERPADGERDEDDGEQAAIDREPHRRHRPARRGDERIGGEQPEQHDAADLEDLHRLAAPRMRAQSSTETANAPMSPAIGETRRISAKKTAKGERLSRMLTTSASGGW